MAQLRIPRWVGTADRSHPQVHVFCDASERAYGVVFNIISCVVNDNVVHLACRKNLLASVKKVTLPMLELLAALVGATLLRYFCHATFLDITEATLWTDTTVALGCVLNSRTDGRSFCAIV